MTNLKSTIVFFSLLSSIICFGQNITPEFSWDGEISFLIDSDFAKLKKIERINYEYSTKRPGKVINPSDEFKECYYQNGLLLEDLAMHKIGSTEIHNHLIYKYEEAQLKAKLEKDNTGYTKTYYSYSGDTLFYDTFRSPAYGSETDALDSTLITSGKEIHTDRKSTYFNRNNIRFKETIISIDSIGFKLTETLKYPLSNTSYKKLFGYNKEGLLAEINYSDRKEHFKLYYDKYQVLQTVEKYLDKKLIVKYEVVYDQSGFLDAILKKDLRNNHIHITNLKYQTLEKND